jgi:hypothetical protein
MTLVLHCSDLFPEWFFDCLGISRVISPTMSQAYRLPRLESEESPLCPPIEAYDPAMANLCAVPYPIPSNRSRKLNTDPISSAASHVYAEVHREEFECV